VKRKKGPIQRSCSLVISPFKCSKPKYTPVFSTPISLYLSSMLFFTLSNPFASLQPFCFSSLSKEPLPRMQHIPFYVLILSFLLIPTSLVSSLYGSSSYSFSLFIIFRPNFQVLIKILNIHCLVSSLQMGPYMTSLPTLR